MVDSVESAVVPAVGTGGSLSVVRSLGRAGINTIAVSDRKRPPSFSSRYCGETETVPDPAADLKGYSDALLALARREDVELIVPVREADVYVLARDRERFAEHLGTPWPTFEQLQRVHDRIQLFEAAERAGVAVPETRLLDEIDDWGRERIAKGRYAILTSDNCETVPDGHLQAPPKTTFLDPGVKPDIDAIVAEMGHVPIAQTYVDGTEYCFRGLYRDGEAVVTSQKKLIRGYKYSRGPSVYHEAVDLPGLEAAGLALLDELDWEGIASVGFIRDEEGTFNLLEINPRIPASLPMDSHAGLEYPYYWWQLATDQPVSDHRSDYRSGVASHLLRGEIAHLHSVVAEEYALAERPSIPGTVWNIASSLVSQPHFDYFSLDDPAPFVRDWINVASGFLGEK
jgi:predicted ATP-grasp superfamily ATP-dependent carboligase